MGLTGDFGRLARLREAIANLGKPGAAAQFEIARSVIKEVRGVLREQFSKGEGPDGAWQRTARGKPALVSRKLATTFVGAPVNGGAKFRARIPWLLAHHEGHVFPARSSAGHVLYRSRKGKLISAKRAARGKGAYGTKARAHTVGARVLPARPIYPTRDESAMPAKWAAAINRGARAALEEWASRL